MRAARLLTLVGSLFAASTVAFSQVTISTQPRAVTVTSGQSAALSVTASAPNALSYQWRRNGYSIPGATGASYTLAAAWQGDSDLYDVVVTSSPSSVASQVTQLLVTPISYPGAVAVDLTRSLRLAGPG